jgi:polysaccharide export outer membrane protein
MNRISPKNLTVFIFLGCAAFSAQALAQTPEAAPKRINFLYSQNPKSKAKSAAENQTPQTAAETNEIAQTSRDKNPPAAMPDTEVESGSAAKKTAEISKHAGAKALKPTEIYKVGAGDVLFINLLNAPAKSSNYFTVLNDGTIDFPLVGEMIPVGGLTTDEIEDLLREKIKLYANPQVSVKVRDYSSHSINVFGLVEKPGEQFMQREAKPLFVVRAEAIAQPKANRVVIKRADSTTETFDLNDSKYEDVLVFPGDFVEFGFAENKEPAPRQPQFYYIGGDIYAAGQKDFYQGITLTQAIMATGGLRKPNVKKIVIRRKNTEGLLNSMEYNLKAIKDGKQPDPSIQPGDTIEVGN